MRSILILSALLAPALSFAEEPTALKPNPLTCVGYQDGSGEPLVLDMHFTDDAGQVGGRISYNRGHDGRQAIEASGPLLLVKEESTRLEAKREGEFALSLTEGDLDRVAKDAAEGNFDGEYSYRLGGKWAKGDQAFTVSCEAKFVK